MSGISGRHLFYFSMKCVQLTRSVYVPFLSKKEGKIFSTAEEPQFKEYFPERTEVWIQCTPAFVPQTHHSSETPLAG